MNKEKLKKNCEDILRYNYKITNSNKVLIIWDESDLAINLRDSFEEACKNLNSNC
jgi:hypothetical protein